MSTRTVYRDVDALGTSGIPVYTERGAQGGIRLIDGYRTDLTGMSEGEAETLLVMGIPGPLDQLGLADRADAARRKVLAALPAGERGAAEAIRQRLHVDPSAWRPPRGLPHLLAVADALWADRRIRIEYVRADNEQVQRTLDPLGLVLKAGTWYLVATSGRWEATFRVERILRATILDQPARRPDDFDLVSFWDTHVEELAAGWDRFAVRLAVERHAAASLPAKLGEGTREQLRRALAGPVTDGDPDRIIVDVVFGSRAEAVSAVLGLGADAEVVTPDEVRAELGQVAARLARRYGAR